MKPVNIDQLRVLVAICDTGSFSAAGRKLNRVQSAISQAIRNLEQAHQVVLFDRAMTRPILTDGGKQLVEQAREVMRQATIFNNLAEEINGSGKSSLRITLDGCAPLRPFLETIDALRARFPDADVQLHVESAIDCLRRLRNHSANLGISVMQDAIPLDLAARKLFEIAMLPVVGVNHPLAATQHQITEDSLKHSREITWLDACHETMGTTSGGIAPWHCVDLARRCELLFAGLGWCHMPAYEVCDAIASGKLVVLDRLAEALWPPPLSIYALRAELQPRSPVLEWLVDDYNARLLKMQRRVLPCTQAA